MLPFRQLVLLKGKLVMSKGKLVVSKGKAVVSKGWLAKLGAGVLWVMDVMDEPKKRREQAEKARRARYSGSGAPERSYSADEVNRLVDDAYQQGGNDLRQGVIDEYNRR